MSNSLPINKVSFFEFCDIFFTDTNKWNRLTDKAKSEHVFMMYRKLATKYPHVVQIFQRIHDVRILNSLHRAMVSPSVPRWNFTKDDKVPQESKHFVDGLKNDEIMYLLEYLDYADISSIKSYCNYGSLDKVKKILKERADISKTPKNVKSRKRK